jgi:RHS repeat-associated protein
MKKIYTLLLICFSQTISTAQNNYSKVTVPLVPVTTPTAAENLGVATNKLLSISYTDGLGRPLQSISMRQGIELKDMVSFTSYDQYGRSLKTYSPYAKSVSNATTGQFVANPIAEQATFYQTAQNVGHTDYPFAETQVENSPLQRPLKQGGIGEDWQITGTRTTQAEYLLNSSTDNILKFALTTVSNTEYSASAMVETVNQYYPENKLVKNATIDVNGLRSETFTDMQGRKVCSRVFARVSTDANGNFYTQDITNGESNAEPTGTITALSTYYIYNDLGQMIYEVPQNAIKAMVNDLSFGDLLGTNQSIFNNLIYAYHYDERGRLIEKHVPGTFGATTTNVGWHYFLYNKRDQLVLSQDPNQAMAATKNYTFTKYDAHGRVILTGKFNSSLSRASIQTTLNSQTIFWENRSTESGNVQGYTNSSYPTTQAEIYTVSYYDDYDFPIGTANLYQPWENNVMSHRTRGMLTGSKVKILGSNPVKYLLSINYYDEFGRTIQSHIEHHKHGWDVYNNEYDFTGKLTKSQRDHTYSGNDPLTIINRYTYDTEGRPNDVYQTTGNDPEMIVSSLSYNALGQVIKKSLHNDAESSDFMQNIDYRYNEKGWLTNINNSPLVDDGGITNSDINDVFGEEILYHTGSILYTDGMLTPDDVGIRMKKRYDGNIAAIKWQTKDPTIDGTTKSQNCYVYRYDDLGRMTGGFYAMDGRGGFQPDIFSNAFHHFDEKVSYDINGNILLINRKNGVNAMDDLKYTYNNGYKLTKVSDFSTATYSSEYPHFIDGTNTDDDYIYDNNGNQIVDKNKGIEITYNYLNLPSKVKKVVASISYYVNFVYDATGKLLSKKLSVFPLSKLPFGMDRDYIDGIEYNGDDGFMYAATAEGVVRKKDQYATNTTDYVYDYYLKDHLGNVRAILTNENATYTVIDGYNSFTATMENSNDPEEEQYFDNLDETRKNKTADYPYNANYPINAKVSKLGTNTGQTVGPATIVAVGQGDQMSVSTEYFFTTPTLPQTNQTASQILAGIIGSITTAGVGTLPTDDLGAVINPFSDQGSTENGLLNTFINSSFDTLDLTLPQGYLVTMFFDNKMNLDPQYSGVQRVETGGSLNALAVMNLKMPGDGYYYTYVTNQSAQSTQFDNLTYVHIEGQLREVNDYYPYGLLCSSATIGNYSNYKFQDKEFNSKEFEGTWGLDWYNHGARMYDPELGRWHVQDPALQFANPYLAMGNNPVSMTDPDGQFIFTAAALIAAPFTAGASLALLPYAIGADIGMWSGGSIANGTANPFKWDYSSGKTWGYMAAGAAVGAASGGLSNTIATSGGAFAQTQAIIAGSMMNSMGTALYTGGQTDVTVGFGAGSFNINTGELGYLGKKGNSAMENIGYGLGAMANAADLLAGLKPNRTELRTENTSTPGDPDFIGHSQLVDANGKPVVDWGPDPNYPIYKNAPFKSVQGTNSYEKGLALPSSKMKWNPVTIDGVNTNRIASWNPSGNYNLAVNSCVSQTSRALNASGAYNIGIHPYMLHAQMYLRSVGVRPLLYSHYLTP